MLPGDLVDKCRWDILFAYEPNPSARILEFISDIAQLVPVFELPSKTDDTNRFFVNFPQPHQLPEYIGLLSTDVARGRNNIKELPSLRAFRKGYIGDFVLALPKCAASS